MRFLSALLLLAVAAIVPTVHAQTTVGERTWEAYLPPEGNPASPLGFWRGVVTRDGASQVIELTVTANDTMAVGADTLGVSVYTAVPDWFAWPGYTWGPTGTFADGVLEARVVYGYPVRLRLDPVYGELIGRVEHDGPVPITAHFRRAVRPPRPAVRETELTVQSGDARIAGTLVTPAGPGPHPTVVYVHSRGPASRGWRSYAGQAEALARYGVAGFVYDKRGVAASTGDYETASLHDHAADVGAVMAALAERSDVDGGQIGLHGTSAGGWVSLIAQAESPVRPAFVVTRVGPFESVYDQQWHVAEAYMGERGYTDAQIASAIEYVQLESGTDASDAAVEAMRAGARRAEAEGWDDILVDPPTTREELEASWARVNRYDPADDLRQLTVPLLAFFGEEDYVVHPRYNVPTLEAAMSEAGNDDVTIVVHPGMGHGLENPNGYQAAGDDPLARYFLWNRIAAGYGETLVAWVLDRVTLASERDG